MFKVSCEWNLPKRHKGATTEAERILRIRLHPESTSSAPVHVAMALDTSGSMEGTRLSEAKRACLAACSVLRPQDFVSLATFSTDLQVLVEKQAAGTVDLKELERNLAGLTADGITRTDLALNWLKTSLATQLGGRFAILATDGHPTNKLGEALQAFDSLEQTAGEIGGLGMSLSCIGLGSAENFHPRFLLDLTDKGQGKFFHAASDGQLTEALREHFRRATQVGATEVVLCLRPRLSNLRLTACCQIAPEFRPKDPPPPEAPEWRLRVSQVQGQVDTDLLLKFKLPKPAFGEKAGVRPVLELQTLVDGQDLGQQAVNLEFVASSFEEQQGHDEVKRAATLWGLNSCQDAIVRSQDVHRTGRLLQQLEQDAGKVGAAEVAQNAKAQLEQLQREGKFDPNSTTRNTQLLRDLGGQL